MSGTMVSLIIYGGFFLVLSVLFVRFVRFWAIFLWLSLLGLAGVLSLFFHYSTVLVVVGLLVLVIAPITFPLLRLLTLTPWFFARLNKQKINISPTEQTAIDSGDTYWEKNLFNAQLDWTNLSDLPEVQLSGEEQTFLSKKVDELCHLFLEHGLDEVVLSHIKEHKFWALNIDKYYGGLGFKAKAQSHIISRLASCDTALAVTVMVPNSLGAGELLQRYGTQQQKDYYLPRLASGKEVPCFALTSQKAGSDASAISDSGVVCYGQYQGKKTLGLRLNWSKRYTTLAPIATIIGLAFKASDPDGLLSGEKELGISCALVPTHLDGVKIGYYHHPMGLSFANGPHTGEDVFIPMDCVIGGEDYLGRGWEMLMQSLAAGRGISLPALAISGCALALKTSVAYCHLRQQFHRPLSHFEGVSEKLLKMASSLYILSAMSDFNSDTLARGYRSGVISAMLKYHHTECLRQVINDAMDIHGGKAIMLGEKNYLAKLYQSIPIAITVEGANIITRSLLIYGQGLLRCHLFLYDYLKSYQAQDKKNFNRLLGQHIGHLYHLAVAALTVNFGFDLSSLSMPKKATKPCYRHYRSLTRLSYGFALLSEYAVLRFGIQLKKRETLSGLFADLLIKLYAISSVLRAFEHSTNQDLEADLLHYSCSWYSYQARLLLLEISQQLVQNRYGRMVLRMLVLPFGLGTKNTHRALNERLNEQLIQGGLTKHLSYNVFCPPEGHILTKLENAHSAKLANNLDDDLLNEVLAVDDYKSL